MALIVCLSVLWLIRLGTMGEGVYVLFWEMVSGYAL